MKKLLIKYAIGLILAPASLWAQTVSDDSINALKLQKKEIEANGKLNEDKIALAKLENELVKKINEARQDAQKAQISANRNNDAAKNLINNAQNKKSATQARSAARAAQHDARKARNSEQDVKNLKADIESLKGKIVAREAELTPSKSVSFNSIKSLSAPANSSAATESAALPKTQPMADQKNTEQLTSIAQTPQGNVQPQTRVETVQDTDQIRALIEKILASTNKSDPQQSAQPSIVINNIIVPADYTHTKTSGHAADKPEKSEYPQNQDYQDFKAWQKERNEKKVDVSPDSYSLKTEQATALKSESETSSETRSGFNLKERMAERPLRNSGLWVIPVVGVHASDFNADFKEEKAKGRTGWNAGLDFRIRARRFFVQPGIHYFSSSLKLTSNDSVSNATLLRGPRIHSLKAPLLLGLYLTKANSGFVKVNLKGGASANYVLSVDKNDQLQFEKNNIEDFSFGLNAGIGLEFGLITLDVSHEWGISKLFKDNDSKNNILRLTLGVKL